MFDFLQKGTEINTTQIVDEIEAAVYVLSDRMGSKSMAERFTASSRRIFHR